MLERLDLSLELYNIKKSIIPREGGEEKKQKKRKTKKKQNLLQSKVSITHDFGTGHFRM